MTSVVRHAPRPLSLSHLLCASSLCLFEKGEHFPPKKSNTAAWQRLSSLSEERYDSESVRIVPPMDAHQVKSHLCWALLVPAQCVNISPIVQQCYFTSFHSPSAVIIRKFSRQDNEAVGIFETRTVRCHTTPLSTEYCSLTSPQEATLPLQRRTEVVGQNSYPNSSIQGKNS